MIKVVLDEIMVKGKDVSFKRDVYMDVYVGILGLMSKCDTSPVHCAKIIAFHVQWAKIGWYLSGGDGYWLVVASTGWELGWFADVGAGVRGCIIVVLRAKEWARARACRHPKDEEEAQREGGSML
ncbi:hypothetical protein OG21DRAFT_1526392 [Imleria badia]|nr:hypothetical protein OG21DRAFT_1526392 [Imleria badia]